MENYYTVSQYAQITGKDPGNIRKMLIAGRLMGEKAGNQWLIPADATFPVDKRINTGNYRNWRKRTSIRQSNPVLMTSVHKMCKDLAELYGPILDRIVLYGSYARGEETAESDVDIALMLKDSVSSQIHDRMTDIVVDYELAQGVTLSVVSIDCSNYMNWNKTLPFYKNIEKEGIVLWKAV